MLSGSVYEIGVDGGGLHKNPITHRYACESGLGARRKQHSFISRMMFCFESALKSYHLRISNERRPRVGELDLLDVGDHAFDGLFLDETWRRHLDLLRFQLLAEQLVEVVAAVGRHDARYLAAGPKAYTSSGSSRRRREPRGFRWSRSPRRDRSSCRGRSWAWREERSEYPMQEEDFMK